MSRDSEDARRRAEALEDAFGAVEHAASMVGISFKHLKLRTLDDSEAREEIAELADKIGEAFALLHAEGYYDRPHRAEQRRAVAVMDAETIPYVVGYIADDALAEEHARVVLGEAEQAGGMSPVEWAVLPSVAPFFNDPDDRRHAAELLAARQDRG